MHPRRTRSDPQPEQESIFRTVFAGRVRFGGIFRRSLRATTKKRSSTFLARKSAPPDKILATPMRKETMRPLRVRGSVLAKSNCRETIFCRH